MRIRKVHLENWKNFLEVDIELGARAFFVGPNAAGKSNLLDAFRFMADIVKPGGGLQRAITSRGGMQKIRCLGARSSTIVLEFELVKAGGKPAWTYHLELRQERSGLKRCLVATERVKREEQTADVLIRPDAEDGEDDLRLTQTNLEQISSNGDFREIYYLFNSFRYLHIVPQVIKNPDIFASARVSVEDDVFGLKFLEQVAKTNAGVRRSRFTKIERLLKIAVPQLGDLTDSIDEMGVPHLELRLENWRPNAGKQIESQLSDGTLRLIGILWTILDTKDLLMLEEPELSLHPGIVSRLAPLIYRVNKSKKEPSQILISTHSPDLLSDRGIGANEIFILCPEKTRTLVKAAKDIKEVRVLLEQGLSPAEAVLPMSAPAMADQLSLFE